MDIQWESFRNWCAARRGPSCQYSNSDNFGSECRHGRCYAWSAMARDNRERGRPLFTHEEEYRRMYLGEPPLLDFTRSGRFEATEHSSDRSVVDDYSRRQAELTNLRSRFEQQRILDEALTWRIDMSGSMQELGRALRSTEKIDVESTTVDGKPVPEKETIKSRYDRLREPS